MRPVAEAAKTLGIARSRLNRLIGEGRVRTLTLGTKRLVDIEVAKETLDEIRKEGIGIDAISTATGLSVSAIRRGVREGWIPHWLNGRWLRFDEATVCTAIQRRIEEQSKR